MTKGPAPHAQTRPLGAMLREAGAAFFPLEFVAKLPLAMTLVGVLGLVSEARGSIVAASLTSAALGLASAVFGPLIGAAADRWGQRNVLIPVAIANAICLIAMIVVVSGDAPTITLIVVAAAIGVTSPQIGPMGRARWMGIFPGDHRPNRSLAAAMGWESMTDEISFIVGPILVAVLATLIHPTAPLWIAAGIVFVFAVVFALHRTHQYAPRTRRGKAAHRAPMLSGRLIVVMTGMFIIGGFWGVALTTVTAVAGGNGHVGTAGFIYGAMGLSAAVTAAVSGVLPARVTESSKWICGAALAALCAVPLIWTSDQFTIGIFYFAIGVGVGPVLVTIFTLAASLAPEGRSATVMTLVGSASLLGQASLTSINGFVLAGAGISAGFTIAASLLAVLALVGILYRAPIWDGGRSR